MKVLVGISGGPQSLLTAWLLKKQGMQIRGVYFDLRGQAKDREKIQQIERKLGISIQIISLAEEFAQLMKNLLEAAALNGQNIDPKLAFHRHLLFPKLMELKTHHHFTKIATGHSALLREDRVAGVIRVFQSENTKINEAHLLLGLSQEDLGSLILPLGSIPEVMLHKLAQEIDAGIDQDDGSGLEVIRTFSTTGFEVFSPRGVSFGLAREADLKAGMAYATAYDPGTPYRVTDVSFLAQSVTIAQVPEMKITEIIFEECSWFGRGDLNAGKLECGMQTPKHLKPVPLRLLEFEGNRIKGYLNQGLLGEEANIFKGETVLWIEGTEILGGGRVFRTR